MERVADETCRWYLAIACAVVRVIGPHLKDVTEVRLPADEPPFALDPPSVLRWLDGARSNVEFEKGKCSTAASRSSTRPSSISARLLSLASLTMVSDISTPA